jgi:hypothetical protein
VQLLRREGSVMAIASPLKPIRYSWRLGPPNRGNFTVADCSRWSGQLQRCTCSAVAFSKLPNKEGLSGELPVDLVVLREDDYRAGLGSPAVVQKEDMSSGADEEAESRRRVPHRVFAGAWANVQCVLGDSRRLSVERGCAEGSGPGKAGCRVGDLCRAGRRLLNPRGSSPY